MEHAPDGYVERQIREAMARGELDDLPGAGRPLPGLDGTYDPAWWAKAWAERDRAERRAEEARARVDRMLAGVWLLGDEHEVRRAVALLDRELESAGVDASHRLDPGEVLAIWRRMEALRRLRRG